MRENHLPEALGIDINKPALVLVSVNNPLCQKNHFAMNMKDLKEVYGEKFRENVKIMVFNIAQRHNVARDNQTTADEEYGVAQKLGQEWWEEHKQYVSENKSDPENMVIFAKKYIEASDFSRKQNKMLSFFENEEELYTVASNGISQQVTPKAALKNTVQDFIKKYKHSKKKVENVTDEAVQKASCDFLIEETTCMGYWADEGFENIFYPDDATMVLQVASQYHAKVNGDLGLLNWKNLSTLRSEIRKSKQNAKGSSRQAELFLLQYLTNRVEQLTLLVQDLCSRIPQQQQPVPLSEYLEKFVVTQEKGNLNKSSHLDEERETQSSTPPPVLAHN